jgi:hypothetical protein
MTKSTDGGDCIVLKDEKGQEKIVLDAGVEDFPFIRLIGKNGSALSLQVDKDNPRIILERPGGKHAAIVALTGESCIVVMYDKRGLPSIRMTYCHEEDRPSIEYLVNGQVVGKNP